MIIRALSRLPTVAFLIIAMAVTSVPAEARPSASDGAIDPFGLDMDFTKFCDLADGTKMSDECRGFIGATVEIALTESSFGVPGRYTPVKICIPKERRNVEKIFQDIRPVLRKSTMLCAGLCTSTSYVLSSLSETYPCKQ
jgi:hypothetical protein